MASGAAVIRKFITRNDTAPQVTADRNRGCWMSSRSGRPPTDSSGIGFGKVTPISTSAASIAACLLALVERSRLGDLRWGTYHFSNEPACSWYDFASHIFSRGSALGLLGKAPLLQAITTSEYPTPARRPANSVLSCDKIRAAGIAIPDWRDELETALQAFSKKRSVDE